MTYLSIYLHTQVWASIGLAFLLLTLLQKTTACLALSTEMELYYKQSAELLLGKIPNRVNFSSFPVHVDPPLPWRGFKPLMPVSRGFFDYIVLTPQNNSKIPSA